MSELLQIGPFQLMELWAELVEAWHGVNGFGGDTAEIYAYRFQAYSPFAHWHHDEEKLGEIGLQSARQLYELLTMFKVRHDCRIIVDGKPLGAWLKKFPFNHRVHVRILHKKG